MKINFTPITMFMVLIVVILSGCDNKPKDTSVRFLLASHTYYTIRYPGLFEQYVSQIGTEENLDYIFFLGDLVSVNNDSEWKIVMDATSRLKPKVYYAPGNHDIYKFPYVESQHTIEPYPEWKDEYIRRIGYDYKIIHDDNANFILINSLDPLDNITNFLADNASSIDNGKPNLLMSHHLPWDDQYYKSGWKMWAHKSYRWHEIKPFLANMDHLIAGDRCDHCRNANRITPLEGGQTGYNTGIGGPGTPLFYIIAELRDGKITLETKTVPIAKDHPYFTEWR